MSLTDPDGDRAGFAPGGSDDALDAPAFQAAFEAMGGAQALAPLGRGQSGRVLHPLRPLPSVAPRPRRRCGRR